MYTESLLNFTKRRGMKALQVLIALMFMAGCETLPSQSDHASGQTRYLCYTYVQAEHVLTLPVPSNNEEVAFVDVWFQGNTLPATYNRKGLTQLWHFDVDGLYVKVDPDNSAQYWDFRGASDDEKRKPEAVFKCQKRA